MAWKLPDMRADSMQSFKFINGDIPLERDKPHLISCPYETEYECFI